MRNKKRVVLCLVVSAVLLIVGCPKNEANTPGENEIWMANSAFDPASKTVVQGTTITWTNKDAVTHTVTSGLPTKPDGRFDSGDLGPNGTFSFKFDSVGTFAYYCKHHSGMTGMITVP